MEGLRQERLRQILAWDEAVAVGVKRFHLPVVTHLMRVADWRFTAFSSRAT